MKVLGTPDQPEFEIASEREFATISGIMTVYSLSPEGAHDIRRVPQLDLDEDLRQDMLSSGEQFEEPRTFEGEEAVIIKRALEYIRFNREGRYRLVASWLLGELNNPVRKAS